MKRLFTFSSIDAEKKYNDGRLKVWEDYIVLLLIVNFLYFTYRAGNYFYEDYEVSSAIRNDIVMGVSLLTLSVGRRFCLKWIEKKKYIFLFVTDMIAVVLFTIFPYLVKRNVVPYTLGYTTAYPLSIDFFILYLLVVPLFYNWYMPMIGVLITLITYIVGESGYHSAPTAGLVLHSVSVLLGIIIESYIIEKLKRDNFEA
jgi:hypothetical protein